MKAVVTHPLDRELAANELAIRARSGCATAFSILADRYRPRLVRFLEKRHPGRIEDAEDVVQETLTRAWQNISKYDSRYHFSTWLYTLAVRISVDHYRRSRRWRERPCASPQLIDSRESVELVTVKAETSENIWAVAQAVLSKSQFSAVWLRYGEEMTTRDVARALGKTTVGVRVLLHRSRQTLAPFLREYAGDGRELSMGLGVGRGEEES